MARHTTIAHARRAQHYMRMGPYLEKCVFPTINWRGIWTHSDTRWEVVKVAFAILQLEEYYPFFMKPYIPGFIQREVRCRKVWTDQLPRCPDCGIIYDICSEYNH